MAMPDVYATRPTGSQMCFNGLVGSKYLFNCVLSIYDLLIFPWLFNQVSLHAGTLGVAIWHLDT